MGHGRGRAARSGHPGATLADHPGQLRPTWPRKQRHLQLERRRPAALFRLDGDEVTSMALREGDRMNPESRLGTSRRAFLKATGLGALGTVVAGGAVGALGRGLILPASAATTTLSLVASDGYMTVPGRED